MSSAGNLVPHSARVVTGLPTWVPDHARHYLAHVSGGISIRALARRANVHASTILRQVRRAEASRDDPLVDAALRRLETQLNADHGCSPGEDSDLMTASTPTPTGKDDAPLMREGARILRRLCETGAVLAVAAEMEKAVVVRDTGTGAGTRTAVTDSPVAAMLALKDWISTEDKGRIRRYTITSAGKSALRAMKLPTEAGAAPGFAEDQSAFLPDASDLPTARRRMRYGMAESPLIALARRRDKDGAPFLTDQMVHAGERLREDFELSQLGPQVSQDWERFLTAGIDAGSRGDGAGQGSSDARARVAAALADLGPGLADVVLRCCCYLEGLESAEKKMGWSARSGKIVLRIALTRLQRHYTETTGPGGPMIG